jgi:hypothetical protein
MATLSDLVETIAQVEGMEPATVSLIARNVREAGLISKKGRGLSAAKMTLTDAANLLIAVNTTAIVRESPQTVRIYRQLEEAIHFRRNNQLVLAERVQLGRALEQLIEAASNGTFQRFFSMTVPALISQEFQKEQIKIELVFHKPLPHAYLSISTLAEYRVISADGMGLLPEHDLFDSVFKRATTIEFEFESSDNQIRRAKKKYRGDRKDTTSIGFPTIRAVAKLVQK